MITTSIQKLHDFSVSGIRCLTLGSEAGEELKNFLRPILTFLTSEVIGLSNEDKSLLVGKRIHVSFPEADLQGWWWWEMVNLVLSI